MGNGNKQSPEKESRNTAILAQAIIPLEATWGKQFVGASING